MIMFGSSRDIWIVPAGVLDKGQTINFGCAGIVEPKDMRMVQGVMVDRNQYIRERGHGEPAQQTFQGNPIMWTAPKPDELTAIFTEQSERVADESVCTCPVEEFLYGEGCKCGKFKAEQKIKEEKEQEQ